MTLGVFDLFKVGIGPSSSHTMGPMSAAREFALELDRSGALARVSRVRVELFGSLGATGEGHGTVEAVIWGLSGETPDEMDPSVGRRILAQFRGQRQVDLLGKYAIALEPRDVRMTPEIVKPYHPNACEFAAFDAGDRLLHSVVFYSIGGGLVHREGETEGLSRGSTSSPVPYPFESGADLLRITDITAGAISQIAMANELHSARYPELRAGLLRIWAVMQDCVRAGCSTEGVLPGELKVQRRAARMHRLISERPDAKAGFNEMDWVNLYALAVNEQNASGGRVVTAPTNGAAGVIPAVLHYHQRFIRESQDDVCRFLLTAGAIGSLIAEGASISGAEVGCQGEVGAASAMAAGGLAELLGGTPRQVENAAEIALEHHLGMTCDPIGGLVQIPCIERNAMGAVKAINAARIALAGDGNHVVSLDKAIQTMRETGRDMHDKYKETSRGGLAVNVVDC